MFGKVADHATSGFFKGPDHLNDIALLIEPRSVNKGVPSEYKGQVRLRDEMIADVSVFANTGDINAEKPSQILKSVNIAYGMVVGDLEHFLGGAVVVKLSKIDTKSGSGYVVKDIKDEAILTAVGNFYSKRTEAAASAPEFV